MTRRLEAGPLLVTLGALLLLVSLFLDWFAGGATAWQAFEVWDLVLFVLAVGVVASGIGLMSPDLEVIDRRFLPGAVAAMAVIVAAQIIDPPPAVAGQDPDTGAWLALASVIVMCAGGLLTYGRVRVAFTVEEREAADAGRRGRRARAGRSDDREPPGRGARRRGGQAERPAKRLFARERSAEPETDPVAAGNEPPEPKQD